MKHRHPIHWRRPRRGLWLIMALIIAAGYRDGHPWSGLLAGLLAFICYVLLMMIIHRLSLLAHLRGKEKE